MNPLDYEVDIFPLSEADGGGFAAVAPELPGCRSDGDTPQKALENIYDAVRCWTAIALDSASVHPIL